jgi:hypothetical protein
MKILLFSTMIYMKWYRSIVYNVLRIKNRFNVFYTLLAVVVYRGLTKFKI